MLCLSVYVFECSMLDLNKKLFSFNVLNQSVLQIMTRHAAPSALLFGLSCAFVQLSYAENVLVISNPNTEAVDEAIAKEEQEQQEQINEALEDKQEVEKEQVSLDQVVYQFQVDEVYQLQDSDIPAPDQAMLNEINQIAAQAQQDAEQQERSVPSISQIQVNQKSTTASEFQTTTSQMETVNVDQLVTTLQQQQVTVPDFQENSADPSQAQATNIEPKKERGFFARLFNRDEDDSILEKLPKIKVEVRSAEGKLDEKLEKNLDAKLSTFTQEAFEAFNVALPQIKEMANVAAQAVGYYEAEFKFSKQDEETLIVDVLQNEPVLVAEQPVIEFSGDGAEEPVFQVVSVVPDLNEGDILNHGDYENMRARIDNASDSRGYFDGFWRMRDVKVTLPENTADILMKYETGERYKLNAVEFRMSDPNEEFPLRKEILQQLVPFKEGDDYTEWRSNLLSSNLINSRYFNYTLVNVAKPDPITKPLELPPDLAALHEAQQSQVPTPPITDGVEVRSQHLVDEGEFIGTEGNEAQNSDVQSGESINSKSAGNENQAEQDEADGNENDSKKQALAKSQSEADKRAEETEKLKAQARETKKVPVIVTLNADNPNSLETGIGYGTDTGVRLRSQYRRAIVNDRGHSLDVNLQLSENYQSIDGRYNIPYKHPLNDYFSVVGGYEREIKDKIGQGVELNIESGVIGAERTIKKPMGQWQHNMSVRYRLDSIEATGNVDPADMPDAFRVVSTDPEQESLLFGYEISRTDQNNYVNPTKGFRQFYRAEVGSESLLTETDMAILNAGWRFIYSLGENADHQFVGRGDLGYIVTDDFDRVPYNLRYFAGGDQSVRGYDYESLSPEENGLLLGGQTLAVGSLEYNYQFREGWRAAVFADAGNAYDENFSNETKYGVGIGVRWASPVGPIRVDVAAGVSEDSVPIRLHFFIGPPL